MTQSYHGVVQSAVKLEFRTSVRESPVEIRVEISYGVCYILVRRPRVRSSVSVIYV
jgi:hypothetical protein